MERNLGCWLGDVNVYAIPVQVVGLGEEGILEFPNLDAAQHLFPELALYTSSHTFTWAMRGELSGAPALRFETWAAYKFLCE